MSAIVKFDTIVSSKWLKVTDNITKLVVDQWFQDTAHKGRPITVSTFDESNGEVKVEVKRNPGDQYSIHNAQMPVQDGQEYSIDDSGLP